MKKNIIDKDFGYLVYVEDLDDNAYWAGSTQLQNHESDIRFEAHENGPTIMQREFFKNIKQEYLELISKIYKVLPKKLKENKQLANISYFIQHFTPKALLIPRVDLGKRNWSITFQSTQNEKHFLDVEFKDLEPKKSILEK